MDLESRGIPGGFIASSAFITAAQAQGEALGFHPAKVFVPHPIQDRTDEEIRALAENAIQEILAMVRGAPE
jgi:hypothetical protein